jgi:hypothetical protein
MNELLQESRRRLLYPLAEMKMIYLIIFNFINVFMTISFMLSGKAMTGQYVLAQPLMYTYISSIILSFIAALFNFIKLYDQKGKISLSHTSVIKKIITNKKVDDTLAVISVILILSMSVGGILGYGNKSSDALLTNFSFAHAMIIATVLIIGRKGALTWGFCVIVALFYNMHTLGWDYEYHYLTPTEVKEYKTKLAANDKAALERKAELEANKLSPPSSKKYFRLWIIFISISMVIAYAFGGVVNKVVATVPSVISNIDESIQASIRLNMELEQQRTELVQKQNETTKAAMKVARYNDLIDTLNKEIDKLDYGDKKKLSEVSNALQRVINQEQAWEEFSTNFDSIHSNFFKSLKNSYPELSQLEARHLAYIKMNLSSSDIARQLDVQIDSLRVMRSRLKKKLQVQDLGAFVKEIE